MSAASGEHLAGHRLSHAHRAWDGPVLQYRPESGALSVGPAVTSVCRSSENLVRVVGSTEPGAPVEGANSTLTDAGFGEVVPADEAGRFTATLLAARGNASR